jgi:hypothetical protein
MAGGYLSSGGGFLRGSNWALDIIGINDLKLDIRSIDFHIIYV